MPPAPRHPAYQRGKYWLDFDRGSNGEPRSPNYCIFWYDERRGRTRSKSTGSADFRIACNVLDLHYLENEKAAEHFRDIPSLHDIISDYRLEHGSKKASADAIKHRLKHFTQFIDAEIDAERLPALVTVEHVNDALVTSFRQWSAKQPVTWKNKDGNVTKTAVRTASYTEDCVLQLRAAIRHAYKKQRIKFVPFIQAVPIAQLRQPMRDRLTVAQMAEILDYANTNPRRDTLLRYMIAAICTLARPDAILDMSVDPKRKQWDRAANLFYLNPEGRTQTKKYRPIVPVSPLLNGWLELTKHWFVQYRGGPIKSVHTAWNAMLKELGMPDEWEPKLMRHSMATELRRRKVDPWELSGQMGHRVLSTTETYAIYAPDYLSSVQVAIADIVKDLGKAAPAALMPRPHPGKKQSS